MTQQGKRTFSALAMIPARAGSLRVKSKNIRFLAGHPLIAYSIAHARQSGKFERVICSTDSELIAKIARHYGADVPFLRPEEFATALSPDIDWISYTLKKIPERYDIFSIVRPTSPFRSNGMIARGFEKFLATEKADSLRAVELCKQHPGKMWVLDEKSEYMSTLLPQEHLKVAWHAGQYQALPKVYVQNSSLEIAWTRVVTETHTREGKILAPFLTENFDGFTIDYEEDWSRALELIREKKAFLPKIEQTPYPLEEDSL